jgi:hypothetical protein
MTTTAYKAAATKTVDTKKEKTAEVASSECSKETARALTEQIQTGLRRAAEMVGQTVGLIKEAYERGAWKALGYATWDDYCVAKFATDIQKLTGAGRLQAVAELTGGERPMSNRAVAAALGVDESTVRADRRAGAENPAPAPEREAEAEAAPGIEVVDAEVVDEHQTEPEPEDTRPQRRVVRGADGKNYVASTRDVPPPAPRKRGSRRTHQQVVEAMTASLTGIATVLDDITDLDGSITRDEAAEFLRDLTQQVRALNRVKNLLKKYAEAADRADAAERGDVG